MTKSKNPWPVSDDRLHHALVATLGLEKTEAEKARNTEKAWKKFEARLQQRAQRSS